MLVASTRLLQITSEHKLKELNISNIYFSALLVFLIYLLWLIMKPFLGAIIFASIITGAIYPLFILLLKKTQLERWLTSIIMCGAVIVAIFIPIMYITFELYKEAVNLFINLTSVINNHSVNNFLFGDGYIAQFIKNISSIIGVEPNMGTLKVEVIGYIKSFSGFALKSINSIVGNIVKFLFDFVIMLLVIYSLLAEGPKLKKFILKLSPLPDDHEELIIDNFNQMNFVTLICNGIGGLMQGIMAGIGLWIAGINSVLLWITIMVILAFIPLAGISIVYIPICIYLALTDNISVSLTLFIYCSLVAFLVENWFKPRFIGNRVQINSLFVLLSIIGGMSVFGIAGIFYGPLIAIIFLTTVDLYHKFYSIG